MKVFFNYIFLVFFFQINGVYAQTDVVILSENVGTEIDIDENRFYRIFPREKGFINAQIIKSGESTYKVTIVKKNNRKSFKVIRLLNQTNFQQLKDKVDQQPELTKEAKIAMYEGMDFLRAEKVIQDLPKPQFIVLKHSGKKKLKGTLLNFEDNILYIQTASRIEKINLSLLDQISYRTSLGKYDPYRNYFYILSSIVGLGISHKYNSQRPTIYNEYPYQNVPRSDLSFYRYITGIVFGLIFSSEVFDALSTLLTSSDTIILSEAEYEAQNYK